MNKIIILAFALAITANAVCPNTFGTSRSITQAAGTTAQTSFASANKVCASLDTGAVSCCEKTVVDGLEQKGKDLVTALETAATQKDKDILAARKKLADLSTKLAAMVAGYTTAVQTKLTSLNTNDATALKTFFDAYTTDITNFFKNYNTLRTGFTTYQTNRATCLTALVKTEVAGNCLGCNIDYMNQGVAEPTSGTFTVTYTTAFQNTLRTACYPYIASAKEQTDIIRLAYYAAPAESYTAGFAKLANADTTDDTTAVTELTAAKPSGTPTGVAKIPANCDANSCAWIHTDLVPIAKVDQTKAILGGSTTRRILEGFRQGRILADFGPTLDSEVKVASSFVVKSNPGGVVNVNDMSALRVGVISCIVAFFVALLI